jgi:pyruvate/2-oxoglutarate dehydrogenase complex dihydrolipoamide acyltransferase (E2) component
MAIEIKIPEVSGEGKTGIIVRWYKSEGDQVKAGEEVAEAMIEKITIQVQVPSSGKLKVLKRENEEVKEGEVIGYVEA